MRARELDKLSDRERELVGDAADWVEVEGPSETFASRRQTSAQFSLRIERDQIQQVRRIAGIRGTTFSDVVRDAIRNYVDYAQVVERSHIRTNTKRAAAAIADAVPEALSAAL